jgi:hypothetical protein
MCVHESKIYFVKRRDVQWGSDSQIKCELELLKAAIKGKYEYYHLISGVDLPLKTPKEIYNFFDENKGNNYLFFSEDSKEDRTIIERRIKYYSFFQQKIGRNTGSKIEKYKKLKEHLIILQKKLGIDRMKSFKGEFFKGGNWFSITHELAEEVLAKEKVIKKYFYYSVCADEVFVQTIAMNSKYKSSVIESDFRCIDWKRGNPYTFKESDFNELIHSDAMFARKFSTEIDRNIIDRIYEYLKEKKSKDHDDL